MKSLAAFLMLAFVATAADVESGPKADAKVPELKATFATGTHEGKEIDIPSERKDEPTVYIFVTSSKFDRPVFRFIKELDGKLGETNEKAAAFAIWVGGDAEKHKDYLPKVSGSLKGVKTDLAWTTNATPEGWGLNDEATLTVVVVKAKKVSKVFAWRSVNEKDAAKVLEVVK
jgi:hypothetical protein